MEQDRNKDKNNDGVYSKKLRAGRRRTYFFDVRTTRSNDYYLTITESKKRFNEDGYDRHKIFLYKEDFNKFLEGLTQTIDHVKSELMPEYDFDEFSKRDNDDDYDFNDEKGGGGFTDSRDSGSTHRDQPKEHKPEDKQKPDAGIDDDDLKWS